MKRYVLAVFIPPVAVCRFGCAGCCAAPIGVFWLSSIISLIYGYRGGPLGLEGVSWGTVGLGALLWVIAVGWAFMTLRAADADRCKKPTSSICRRIMPSLDESDPFDEVDKAQHL